jgi:DNA-binding response OmpR family regulator
MHKYQVLILEPNNRVRGVIKNLLTQYEYFQIHEAENLKRAERILKSYHIDIVLAEVLYIDGRLMDLLEDTENEFPKFIIVSKHNNIELQEQFFRFGAQDYITKPFNPDHLRLRILKSLSLLEKCPVKNHTIMDLDKYRREVIINKVRIKLTLTEFQIINILIENDCYCRNKELLKYLSTNKGYQLKPNALRIAIKRLRDKFRRTTGMEIIKNKHGQGYFIAI